MTHFHKLTRQLVLAAGLMALTAPFASAVEISDIAIRSDAATIADDAATAFWPNLEADLKNALIEELAGDSSEAGVILQVTVRELSVAKHPSKTTDDGTLATTIMFISGGEPAGALEHTVSVNQQGEDGVTANGVILPRTSVDFYQALVRHYAQTVAEKIRDYN